MKEQSYWLERLEKFQADFSLFVPLLFVPLFPLATRRGRHIITLFVPGPSLSSGCDLVDAKGFAIRRKCQSDGETVRDKVDKIREFCFIRNPCVSKDSVGLASSVWLAGCSGLGGREYDFNANDASPICNAGYLFRLQLRPLTALML